MESPPPRDVMELDDVLRDLEQEQAGPGWQRRGSGQYWIRILGHPAREPTRGHGGSTATTWRCT